jgi:hypothetical protein
MKLVLAALVVSALAAGGAPPAGPSAITIRTRSGHGDRGGAIDTATLQATPSRQRLERRMELPGGSLVSSVTIIYQCDLQRAVFVNGAAETFVIEPTRPGADVRPRRHAGTAFVDGRPVRETRVIDAVDTGERRPAGPLTARHVITTTTVERPGSVPRVVGVRDGWYVDVPRGCDTADARTALVASRADGRVDVKWRGTAKTGYAIEEIDRITETSSGFERTIELLDISEAPIPASAFEIPDGYRAALPLPGGGYDLARADTVRNRVAAYWELASNWVSGFWR